MIPAIAKMTNQKLMHFGQPHVGICQNSVTALLRQTSLPNVPVGEVTALLFAPGTLGTE